MPHLFTLTTTGRILNIHGIEVTRIKDTYNIGEWLLDFRAAYGKPIEGEIIREADIWAWEAATVARKRAAKLPRSFSTYSGRRSI